MTRQEDPAKTTCQASRAISGWLARQAALQAVESVTAEGRMPAKWRCGPSRAPRGWQLLRSRARRPTRSMAWADRRVDGRTPPGRLRSVRWRSTPADRWPAARRDQLRNSGGLSLACHCSGCFRHPHGKRGACSMSSRSDSGAAGFLCRGLRFAPDRLLAVFCALLLLSADAAISVCTHAVSLWMGEMGRRIVSQSRGPRQITGGGA